MLRIQSIKERDVVLPHLIIALLSLSLYTVPSGAAKTINNISASSSTPMAIASENYTFRPSDDESCLGEDDALRWKATGALAPGESFTFTPKVPGCKSHPAVIAVILTSESSDLELSGMVPDNDYASRDPEQKYRKIVAPNVSNTAQLCMFPFYSQEAEYHSVTVTNVGKTTVSNIALEGLSDNDWAIFYYPNCLNADADNDGWNDSFEHTMTNLVYYSDMGSTAPLTLWGSNYLRANSKSLAPNDEVDAYPPDLNDDDLVDVADVTEISQYAGQGNGIPLETISPNPSLEFFHYNTERWRRYDLDGDGYVSQTDVDIVANLVGHPIPMSEDIIAPSARVVTPASGAAVPRGQWYMIKGHVWDNAVLSRVDYLINGKPVCSATNPKATFGYTSPYYFCWWQVPKRQGSVYELAIKVSDAAGNVTISSTVSVVAQ